MSWPLPRDLADPGEPGRHIGPVGDNPVPDRLHQAGGDRLPVRNEGLPCPRRRPLFQKPEAGLHVQPPRRILRIGPAMFEVVHVPQRPELVQPARRCDVEGPAGRKIAAGRQHVDMAAAIFIPVQDCRPAAPLRRQPGKGQFLEIIEDRIDLPVARRIARRPGNHPAGIAVLERQAVGHLRHQIRIAAQDLHACPRGAAGIHFGQHVARGGACRSGAVLQEGNQHQRSRPGRRPASRASIAASSARIRNRSG